jgi:hypothetical protein
MRNVVYPEEAIKMDQRLRGRVRELMTALGPSE